MPRPRRKPREGPREVGGFRQGRAVSAQELSLALYYVHGRHEPARKVKEAVTEIVIVKGSKLTVKRSRSLHGQDINTRKLLKNGQLSGKMGNSRRRGDSGLSKKIGK